MKSRGCGSKRAASLVPAQAIRCAGGDTGCIRADAGLVAGRKKKGPAWAGPENS